ncbi:MAG TPA: DUF4347 domain-containing protein [Byssovorax sp.]
MKGLRVVVVDHTDVGRGRARPGLGGTDGTSREAIGLTPIWEAGAALYERAGVADAAESVSTWREALRFAIDAAERTGRPIASLQAWGHGGFGNMRLGDTRLDVAALGRASAIAGELDALRDALTKDALVWLRCCSAFGAPAGQAFAAALADRLGARVAGHTHVIGFWQSGAHSIAPGERASWSATEGVALGAAGEVVGAKDSSPFAPRTVTALRTKLPAGW